MQFSAWFRSILAASLTASFALAGSDPYTDAQAQIDALKSVPQTSELTARAQTALERAKHFRDLGDRERARIALGVATDWTAAATELQKTIAKEAEAIRKLELARTQEANADKLRVEVEETLARLGRLSAQADALELKRQQSKRDTPKVRTERKK
jgi:uncharacterized membrane protein YccC